MSQIARVEIKNEWENLETLISTATGTVFSFDSTSTYWIQNVGSREACVDELAVAPAATDDVDGVIIPTKVLGKYKKGTGLLYVRAKEGKTTLNISKKDY